MTTRRGFQRDREKEDEYSMNSVLQNILDKMDSIGNKMDTTNDLLRDLIKVCDNRIENNHFEETCVKSVNTDESNMYYKSPSEVIQQEINELALQKEAIKIKQRIKVDWSRALNKRKQLYWKQINNACDAEQYEKWLGEDLPILPRKYRITEIPGEPEEQKNIRANMAVERVKGEIQLLRMRSENSQNKVIEIDEQMGSELKKKASGRILDILENMWKADCEKEEKRSQDRWRMKEIWQLDYVRKYGNSIVKEKIQKKPKENLLNRAARNKSSFAEIVNQNSTQENRKQSTSNEQQRSTLRPQENTRNRYGRKQHIVPQYTGYEKRVNNGTQQVKQRKTSSYSYNNNNNSSNNNNSRNNNRPVRPNYSLGNTYRRNGTTYIGRGLNKYFLGGGKPGHGQRFQRQRQQQQRRNAWIQK